MEVRRERRESAGMERVTFLGAARGVELRVSSNLITRSKESCKSQKAQRFCSLYAFLLKLLFQGADCTCCF